MLTEDQQQQHQAYQAWHLHQQQQQQQQQQTIVTTSSTTTGQFCLYNVTVEATQCIVTQEERELLFACFGITLQYLAHAW